MKNRGLTLIELMVAMTIGGIILLALTCQFVAEQTFRIAINNQVAATNDASIAMRHMMRVLRYAKQSTVQLNSVANYDTSIKATIDHAVAHPADNYDNLPGFTTDTVVIYGHKKSDSTFEYIKGSNEADIISRNITDFPVTSLWWAEPNKSYKILTIQITAKQGEQGGESSSLESKIRVLGR